MSEVGIGGLLLLYFLFSKILGGLLYRRNTGIFLAVIFIMITGLFDHYWLTLQQNMLLLAFVVGSSFAAES
jgi:predicted Abi (CAAX) family protease